MLGSGLQRFRPEDPRRVRAFREATGDIDWVGEDPAQALNRLFRAVDDLAVAEVDYYYRRRGTRAWISGVARFAAWSLGSIGLLIPLLAATNEPRFAELHPYGYVFLAAAASCLGANALFGGTEGHIRFVATQLELEKIITEARIGWYEYLASASSGTPDVQAGFEQIRMYAEALYAATIAETARWGETLLRELAKLQKRQSTGRLPANE